MPNRGLLNSGDIGQAKACGQGFNHAEIGGIFANRHDGTFGADVGEMADEFDAVDLGHNDIDDDDVRVNFCKQAPDFAQVNPS